MPLARSLFLPVLFFRPEHTKLAPRGVAADHLGGPLYFATSCAFNCELESCRMASTPPVLWIPNPFDRPKTPPSRPSHGSPDTPGTPRGEEDPAAMAAVGAAFGRPVSFTSPRRPVPSRLTLNVCTGQACGQQALQEAIGIFSAV